MNTDEKDISNLNNNSLVTCHTFWCELRYETLHSLHQPLQWFDWWAPLAGDDLHEFKAAVVELNVSGVVILCVDLTGPQRAAVLRLSKENTEPKLIKNFRSKAELIKMPE